MLGIIQSAAGSIQAGLPKSYGIPTQPQIGRPAEKRLIRWFY